MENKHLVLISGKSATGKSASLAGLKNPEGVLYLNCEHKHLPFKHKFKEVLVNDPVDIPNIIATAESKPYHTIVIDTLTYLMDLYYNLYVVDPKTNQANIKNWGSYAYYIKMLITSDIARSTKNFIILAHTSDKNNETEMIQETMVKLKGSIMDIGVESYFSTVISTKKVNIKTLENYSNDLLTLADDDKEFGTKYVFQTRITRDTVGERMRSPVGMWSKNELYIDNNAQFVIDRLHSYYS